MQKNFWLNLSRDKSNNRKYTSISLKSSRSTNVHSILYLPIDSSTIFTFLICSDETKSFDRSGKFNGIFNDWGYFCCSFAHVSSESWMSMLTMKSKNDSIVSFTLSGAPTRWNERVFWIWEKRHFLSVDFTHIKLSAFCIWVEIVHSSCVCLRCMYVFISSESFLGSSFFFTALQCSVQF